MEFNGFVLAGGRGSRMGADKALLTIGGKPLVVRAAEILQPFVREVRLLGPQDRLGHIGLPVIPDVWPDAGPLSAVCTGLTSSDVEWNVFLACDLPLISSTFMELLVQRVRVTLSDAVVPRTEDGWQPLVAAYNVRCRANFVRALQIGQRSIIGRLSEIRVDEITHDDLRRAGLAGSEFTNVNTPAEWARLRDSAGRLDETF
jgi:molybdopterin-guanine dinucleotide biosynthesis protein A